MPPISFFVNGRRRTVTVAPDTPLLWVLRDNLPIPSAVPSIGKPTGV